MMMMMMMMMMMVMMNTHRSSPSITAMVPSTRIVWPISASCRTQHADVTKLNLNLNSNSERVVDGR
jgi:hypothetical protein